MSTREAIRTAAIDLFDHAGVEKTSVAAICKKAGISNGSFFHAFATKDALAADLFLSILRDYHDAIGAAITRALTAEAGIAAIIRGHIQWVTGERRKANFLFEQVRAEWLLSIADERLSENERFRMIIDHWRKPLVDAGHLRPLPTAIFIAQLLGPSQIFCRAWLAGRVQSDPAAHLNDLTSCAISALTSSP